MIITSFYTDGKEVSSKNRKLVGDNLTKLQWQ